jgi:hypothetical protein
MAVREFGVEGESTERDQHEHDDDRRSGDHCAYPTKQQETTAGCVSGRPGIDTRDDGAHGCSAYGNLPRFAEDLW